VLENKSGNISETRKDKGKVTGRPQLTNALSDGAIGTKAHKIFGKVTVRVVKESGSAPIYRAHCAVNFAPAQQAFLSV